MDDRQDGEWVVVLPHGKLLSTKARRFFPSHPTTYDRRSAHEVAYLMRGRAEHRPLAPQDPDDEDKRSVYCSTCGKESVQVCGVAVGYADLGAPGGDGSVDATSSLSGDWEPEWLECWTCGARGPIGDLEINW